jgi:hypothetical protein
LTIKQGLLAIVHVLQVIRYKFLSASSKFIFSVDHKNLINLRQFQITRIRHLSLFNVINKFNLTGNDIYGRNNTPAVFLSPPIGTKVGKDVYELQNRFTKVVGETQQKTPSLKELFSTFHKSKTCIHSEVTHTISMLN